MEIVIYQRQRVDYGEQNDTTCLVPKFTCHVAGPSEICIKRISIERSRTASPGAVLQRARPGPGCVWDPHIHKAGPGPIICHQCASELQAWQALPLILGHREQGNRAWWATTWDRINSNRNKLMYCGNILHEDEYVNQVMACMLLVWNYMKCIYNPYFWRTIEFHSPREQVRFGVWVCQIQCNS